MPNVDHQVKPKNLQPSWFSKDVYEMTFPYPTDIPTKRNNYFIKWNYQVNLIQHQRPTSTVPQSHHPTTNCYSPNCNFHMLGCCFCLVSTHDRLQLVHHLHKKNDSGVYKMGFGTLSPTIFGYSPKRNHFIDSNWSIDFTKTTLRSL